LTTYLKYITYDVHLSYLAIVYHAVL